MEGGGSISVVNITINCCSCRYAIASDAATVAAAAATATIVAVAAAIIVSATVAGADSADSCSYFC